jgi:hypothetical protein
MAGRLLELEHAFSFVGGDPAPAVAEGLSELVITRDRDALKNVLLGIEQGRGGAFPAVAVRLADSTALF